MNLLIQDWQSGILDHWGVLLIAYMMCFDSVIPFNTSLTLNGYGPVVIIGPWQGWYISQTMTWNVNDGHVGNDVIECMVTVVQTTGPTMYKPVLHGLMTWRMFCSTSSAI